MITIDQARRHWRDPLAWCRQVRARRDEAWRIYWQLAGQPGRRFRGRLLDRLNHAVRDARRACPICTQGIDWTRPSLPPRPIPRRPLAVQIVSIMRARGFPT